jgi:nucleoside-diphosphate-sugar epimerase
MMTETRSTNPPQITSEEQLEDILSTPSPAVLEALAQLESNLLILGVGGKMGPTLARMAARALKMLDSPYRVIGVARFSQENLRTKLDAWGIETIRCDLLNRTEVAALPDSKSIIFMAGQKFGTTGNPAQTWAMNVYLPGLVAERFPQARMVVFSTGNVYPLTAVVDGGSQETDPPQPIGEYANTCLGRERIVEYFSQGHGLRSAIMRLNYAIDLRYGVLLDIAQKVAAEQPIDLGMGAVNVIWQGDANAQALGLLAHCTTPPFILNVTGPETISVRRLGEQFGRLLDRPPQFTGQEASTALLNNAGQAYQLFGYPQVSLAQMIDWTAAWVKTGGPTLAKPTHFENRAGQF